MAFPPPFPPDPLIAMKGDPRTRQEVEAHFLVERELAQRLRHSTRAERISLFPSLYGELFARVPQHARVVRRDNVEQTSREVSARLRLVQPYLEGAQTFLEFAPGDCRFAWRVCAEVPHVIAADISDQTGGAAQPNNFRLITYNGYDLALPAESVDVAFSYQFLEHLHPDDIALHFKLAHRLLRPGGAYIFATPHRYSGPHDISRFFSDEPQGFHLKEWTYGELAQVARAAGFDRWHSYRFGKVRTSSLVNFLTVGSEFALRLLPHRLRRHLCFRALEGVTMAVIK